jgi:hypothetical protein
VHFSAIDIKNLKLLLQFSKDVCSLESLEGNTEKDDVDTQKNWIM